MLIIMIVGIWISISNFFLVETRAQTKSLRGAWQDEPDGTVSCFGDGDECDVLGAWEP